jgi:hypothetical protein
MAFVRLPLQLVAAALTLTMLVAPTGACKIGEWTRWTPCSRPCDLGIMSRARENKDDGKKQCPHDREQATCNARACKEGELEAWQKAQKAKHPDIDHKAPDKCLVTEWTRWTDCSAPCNTGSMERERKILPPHKAGDLNCPHTNEIATCNSQECKPGEVERWKVAQKDKQKKKDQKINAVKILSRLKKENAALKLQNDDGGKMLFGMLMVGFVIFYCVVNRGGSKTIQYDTRQLDV